MADIRDWGAFIRGRWSWTRFGYEKGFPRGCQFTDIDAAVEFNGCSLLIEAKHYDGQGDLPDIGAGQRYFLRDEATRDKTVFLLYGCASCNDPYVLRQVGATPNEDRLEDWRGLDRDVRRMLLKWEIDRAMGLVQDVPQPRRTEQG